VGGSRRGRGRGGRGRDAGREGACEELTQAAEHREQGESARARGSLVSRCKGPGGAVRVQQPLEDGEVGGEDRRSAHTRSAQLYMLIDDAEQVAVLSACRRPRQRAHEAQYLVGFLPETHLADILRVDILRVLGRCHRPKTVVVIAKKSARRETKRKRKLGKVHNLCEPNTPPRFLEF
jgi:hypothetical protein